PTITLVPGPNSRRVRSGNDLKPFRVMLFRYIRPYLDWGVRPERQRPERDEDLAGSSAHRFKRDLAGDLLAILLAAPPSAPNLVLADLGHDGEGAIVRGAVLGHDD